MNGKEDAVLNELKFKIERLIKLYTISQDTIRKQQEQMNGLTAEIEALKGENKHINDELKTARVANAISGSGDGSYQAKVRINQLVREIDKCIALLNH
ncbi:MAG: hypothetical protein LBR65_07655 [Culturomica sp.]|jgi:cell division protein FtsB|nr:hypothetical protein [Culturomica sp.]